jgi:hypothetical protein
MSGIVKKGNTSLDAKDRPDFIKRRLAELTKSMAEQFIETGVLLKEYKDNAYYKEHGYESFDEAIEGMQSNGELDFGSRNARNMIAVAEMVSNAGIAAGDLKDISVSKLREIATLPASEQKKMLPQAKDMSVADVQQKAKEIRHKAKGHDVDPYDPIIFKDATATAKTALNETIAMARRHAQLPDNVPDFVVLVDVICAEYVSGLGASVGPDDDADTFDIEAAIDARM